MKTIGKIAALAMTLSLAFVLTACGGSASSSAASSSASASASASSASASSASASASSASVSAASSTAAADADMYTNEYFGIAYKLPSGWTFADLNAVSTLNQGIAAVSKTSEIDMVALSPDQSQIVLVGIEKPSDATAGKTAEQYLGAQEEEMIAGLGGNYSYTSSSATVEFEGIDRALPASVTDIAIEGNHLFIVDAVAEKDGAFFNAIAMGANKDDVLKAFEGFSAKTA